MESTGLVEEAISPELVLVDGELAARARAALPDPPWLLPVLSELQRVEVATPSPKVATPRFVTRERSARPARPRRRSLARHIAATVAGVGLGLLLALAALAGWASGLLSTSEEPEATFATTAAQQVAAPRPSRLSAVPRPRRQARRSEQRSEPAAGRPAARRSVNAKARPKGTSTARKTRSRPVTITSASKPAARPRALAKTQRVFSWHRHAAALYYQFYFQRGARTIYQARTVKLSAVLPAGLKLRRGTYHVLVRPAIPSDAGIILGAAIVAKTMRV